MLGRPHISFTRINRIFPECIAKLDVEHLSESEKRERELFIQNCQRVCEHLASQPPQQKGTNDER